MTICKYKAAFLVLFAWLILFVSHANAQREAPEFELPRDPAAWLNSPPITLDVLKGKAAVLYFFEES